MAAEVLLRRWSWGTRLQRHRATGDEVAETTQALRPPVYGRCSARRLQLVGARKARYHAAVRRARGHAGTSRFRIWIWAQWAWEVRRGGAGGRT